jgi:catechol 2,3-dioxygenase-like lactoylglutathione lyase family enzyme
VTLQLDHIALPAFDGTATLHFYTEVLGLPLVDALSGDDWEGRPWLMMIFGLGAGGTIVLCALHGAHRPKSGDLPREVPHYAIAAASVDELQRWKDRLRAYSIGFSEEDHGTQCSIYFEDPNGHVLEITAPASERTGKANAPAAAAVKAWLDAH